MSRIRELRVPSNGGIPNHPRWPALLVPGAFPRPQDTEAQLLVHGWTGLWRWTVFDFHHFHPDAHEVLACVAGHATLRLGGDAGKDVNVTPGDVIILPAGFGHRRIEADPDFAVMGAYPPGQESPAVERASPTATARFAAMIAAVPRPSTDPVSGGPFPRIWDED